VIGIPVSFLTARVELQLLLFQKGKEFFIETPAAFFYYHRAG
jgi:hypothetical protein